VQVPSNIHMLRFGGDDMIYEKGYLSRHPEGTQYPVNIRFDIPDYGSPMVNDDLKFVGMVSHIKNARVSMFRGERRVSGQFFMQGLPPKGSEKWAPISPANLNTTMESITSTQAALLDIMKLVQFLDQYKRGAAADKEFDPISLLNKPAYTDQKLYGSVEMAMRKFQIQMKQNKKPSPNQREQILHRFSQDVQNLLKECINRIKRTEGLAPCFADLTEDAKDISRKLWEDNQKFVSKPSAARKP